MATAGAVKAGAAYVQFFGDDTRLIRTLNTLQRRMQAFGTQVTAIGQSILKAGLVVSTPLALATKVFASFESQMARVRALTNATEEEFGKLEEKAKALGRDTVFSASQAAEAMSFFALAGFKADQILAAIGPTLDLAAAGQIEIAMAADIAAKIMAGMGIEASNLGSVVDILAKAMTTANTNMEQLGDAFKFVGPIAKSAGISLEEITAAIQLLSNAGIQGEMAGTTLRGMLLGLTSPSKEAAAELARLGVRVKDVRGNVRPLRDIIADMEKALAGVGSADRLESLGKIFDARQAAGAAELISQGAVKLRDATIALGGSAGTAGRIASTQLNTLKGDAIILLSALEGLGIEIGEALAPALRGLVKSLTTAVNVFSKFVKENQKVFKIIGIVSGALVVGGGTLIALGLSAKITAFALGGLVPIFMFFGRALGFVLFAGKALFTFLTTSLTVIWGVIAKAVMTVATAITSALTGAFSAAGGAIASLITPVGILGIALVALAGYFIYASGIIGQAISGFSRLFGQLKADGLEAFGAIRDALAAGDIGAAMAVAGAFMKLEWQRVINLLKELWAGFTEFFLATWDEASARGARFFINAFAILDSAWTQTVDFMADAWFGWIAIVQSTWNSVVGAIAKGILHVMGLFDESLDVEGATKQIDDDTRKKNEAVDDSLGDRTLARQKAREATLSQIEQDRVNTLATLEEDKDRRAAERALANATSIAASEQDLADAKKKFEDAMAAARQKTEEKEAEAASGGKLPGGASIPDPAAGMQAAKTAVSGTFSAAAAAGLGGNKQLDQIANNTGTANRLLRTIAGKQPGLAVT